MNLIFLPPRTRRHKGSLSVLTKLTQTYEAQRKTKYLSKKNFPIWRFTLQISLLVISLIYKLKRGSYFLISSKEPFALVFCVTFVTFVV